MHRSHHLFTVSYTISLSLRDFRYIISLFFYSSFPFSIRAFLPFPILPAVVRYWSSFSRSSARFRSPCRSIRCSRRPYVRRAFTTWRSCCSISTVHTTLPSPPFYWRISFASLYLFVVLVVLVRLFSFQTLPLASFLVLSVDSFEDGLSRYSLLRFRSLGTPRFLRSWVRFLLHSSTFVLFCAILFVFLATRFSFSAHSFLFSPVHTACDFLSLRVFSRSGISRVRSFFVDPTRSSLVLSFSRFTFSC